MFPPRGILLLSPPSIFSHSLSLSSLHLFKLNSARFSFFLTGIYIYTHIGDSVADSTNGYKFFPIDPLFPRWNNETFNDRGNKLQFAIFHEDDLSSCASSPDRKFVIVIIVNRGMHVDRVIDSAFFDIKPFCLTNFPLESHGFSKLTYERWNNFFLSSSLSFPFNFTFSYVRRLNS